ncbi:hypothetical protein PSCICL_47410 [Pseudomonas cichorii]|nr:hypothetical protein PSCICL_47410 [Pseudomonas cichorii]
MTPKNTDGLKTDWPYQQVLIDLGGIWVGSEGGLRGGLAAQSMKKGEGILG